MKPKVLVTIFLAAALAGVFAGHSSPAEDAPVRIAIVAKRWEFAPNEITVKKGAPVTITLTSKDVEHGLKFEALKVALAAKKDKVSEVTFTPEQVGTFGGQCFRFCGAGHGSMKMTLRVTE
jgi:cytochrome c oxidase subunit 2